MACEDPFALFDILDSEDVLLPELTEQTDSTKDCVGADRGSMSHLLAPALMRPPQLNSERINRDICSDCGSQMRSGTNESEYTCSNCGLIIEGDNIDDSEESGTTSGRLRIVGMNSNQFQPDLYRSGNGNTTSNQVNQIYMEYSKYRSQHIENGGRAFNLDACRKAAEKYNIIQQSCVRRSQVKKEIMAGCYYQSCLELGFSPAKSDIAAFMQLQTKGISKGTNFLRSFVADKKIELMEVDPYTPVINSVFASYYGTENGNSDLKKAVYEIVQLCLANGIGTASILRSKIAAATFVVTQRSDKQSPPIGIAEFCVMVGIRRNTVEKFLEEMDNFHSYFEEIYIKFKLDATEPKPREVGKARRASKVVKK
jgi:transcription initiation factor TFIIIB Brf1 subunit/transcription initiation factor TFIIB